MKSPKRLLQDWLGITSIQTYMTLLGDIPVVYDEEGMPHNLDTPDGQRVQREFDEEHNLTGVSIISQETRDKIEEIIKGYESQ